MTSRMRHRRGLCGLALACLLARAAAQPLPLQLAAPVNDFAGVIDAASEQELDRLIRSLFRATGDAIVVATIDTFAPYGDIRAYAVKMFENRGRGIGDTAKDNGLLVLVAVRDRKVWIEVGYGLEEVVTDGFAGETSRREIAPAFRRGDYGGGLVAGVARLAARIAERRGVTLDTPTPRPRSVEPRPSGSVVPILVLVFLGMPFLAFLLFARALVRASRRPRHWGRRGTWSDWHSGVGPFGGGTGGFGGGFGGFGGGSSGGGGGGASW